MAYLTRNQLSKSYPIIINLINFREENYQASNHGEESVFYASIVIVKAFNMLSIKPRLEEIFLQGICLLNLQEKGQVNPLREH